MYKLKEHQIKFSKKILEVLNTYKIAYLAGEVRSQKTLTALEAARLYGSSKVIVITKKKAIPSILSDYENFGFDYEVGKTILQTAFGIERKENVNQTTMF